MQSSGRWKHPFRANSSNKRMSDSYLLFLFNHSDSFNKCCEGVYLQTPYHIVVIKYQKHVCWSNATPRGVDTPAPATFIDLCYWGCYHIYHNTCYYEPIIGQTKSDVVFDMSVLLSESSFTSINMVIDSCNVSYNIILPKQNSGYITI